MLGEYKRSTSIRSSSKPQVMASSRSMSPSSLRRNTGDAPMSYVDLIYSVKDRIATITLNRPDRMNAITPNLQAELHRAFDEADADRRVRVIVLTGAGAAFCAGFDMAA